jgi:glucose-6-phosphate isomerase
MIQIDLTKAVSFLDEEELSAAQKRAESCLKQIKEANGAGAEMLGWQRIVKEPDDAELERIQATADALRQQVDVLVVCGIGGSYLGAKALAEALTPPFNQEKDVEVLFAGMHLGGAYLQDLIRYLESPRPDGKARQVAVNVISKSGTTLETALSFRVLRRWMHQRFPEDASNRIICTTGPEGGVLNKLADQNDYQRFVIPDDVGGRFSVLTPVGLFPAAAAGIDIRALFNGAVSRHEETEANPEELLHYAAARYCFEKQSKAVDLIASFEPELHGFTQWLQQLFGESEGKEGRGIFPASVQYSTDLHSLGQFVQQGTPHMIETFIEVKDDAAAFYVEQDEEDTDQLNYLTGQSFHEINQKALKATREAHYNGEVPCITVSIQERNARNMGGFIYFYELFTAVYCYMLDVNPFNQPGVEDYKQGMYELLGK